MIRYNKDLHRVYSLIYHLIFAVKYRQQVFVEDIGIIGDIKDKTIDLSEGFEVEVLEIECGIEHIHLVISAKPTLDMTKYIHIVKGHSSSYIRDKYSDFFSDILWGNHFWSQSYIIATTGNVSTDVLKRYVEEQRGRDISAD
ncbi:MAG: IS200/IS605 family transposase [Promethearchaeota archaeon]|nr:MAG: IS200/IS605 family transposase [Candidatus Lokiarchaeota archaeon]